MNLLSKYVYYIFLLILVFLFLAYYKGFGSDVTSAGGVLNKLVMTLQGRKSNGDITNYPN